MAHITDASNENPSDPRPVVTNSNDAFIGCMVPTEIKSKLWQMAMRAPGGSRTLSWAINQVLEQHFNKEQSDK